jgi:hypothetical protein
LEKKRLKRQRQKEALVREKNNERWFVRIKSYQAGAASNENKQVVSHWKQ